MRKLLSILLVLSLWPALARAQKNPPLRSGNEPVEPFRILGNLYYVGASDVTSFLITTPEGNILLDSGYEETVPLIRASVKKLGFKMEDVKLLLNTHSHFDHAAGLAALKRLTGAKLVAMDAEAPLLARGGRDDFRFGDELAFSPVEADRVIHDGDTVTLGGVTLTAHKTPGHTPGCTTWTMKIEDGGKSYAAVFIGSATINPGVVLTNNPKYPAIAADYAHTFEVLKALPCDIFLGSHGSFFDLKGKAERLRQGETPNPFIDPQGYREHVKKVEELYRKQLAKEAKR
jgi:metallo-beta-lactamase class B